MKVWRSVWTWGMAVSVTCFASVALAQDHDSSVTLVNRSAYAIHHIQMTPLGARTWGGDMLRGDVLLPGEQVTILVACGTYNMRLVDEDGGQCVVPNVDLCDEDAEWIITTRDLDHCAGFGDEPVAPAPRVAPPPPARPGLTQAEAQALIIRFYNSWGEWAGQYGISQVQSIQFTQSSPTNAEAHVRYSYGCLLDYCEGDLQTGFDQRVFYLELINGAWRVTRMGGHMSARF